MPYALCCSMHFVIILQMRVSIAGVVADPTSHVEFAPNMTSTVVLQSDSRYGQSQSDLGEFLWAIREETCFCTCITSLSRVPFPTFSSMEMGSLSTSFVVPLILLSLYCCLLSSMRLSCHYTSML